MKRAFRQMLGTEKHSQQAAASSSTSVAPGQNYGIRVLYNGDPEACVDVVFIHGLTGNAYDTWLHKETKTHWPSELLRQDLPDIRVLSFGFDADVFHILGKGPASNSRLTNHAENLVNALVRERARSETESRKIIFVAHSLGGLVVEQALTFSKNSAELHLNQIERDTIGIVFLGVPHCGSDLEAWATIGRRMVGLFKQTNKEILDVLNPDSEMLHLVENNFHANLRQRKDNPINITAYYEELAVTGIGEIVPQRSAKIAGYSFIGIHADHQNMTKFSSREDRGYDSIVGELQRWVKSIRLAKQETLHTDVPQLSEAEYDCLRSFCPVGIDYQSQKDQNPKRVPGTCLWTLENPKYLQWRDSSTARLIWISADPGCGKSVLARCIVDEDLPNSSRSALPRHILYYFFKDTSPEQRSASRALCAVLHQLFTLYPQLIRHALLKHKERGAALSTTLPELWSIFTAATADPIASNIFCVLDALDECNDQERPKLIEYLEDFCLRRRISPSISCLKFLVTSRPYFEIRRGFDQLLEASNNIELAGNDESAAIKKEIDRVIEHKVTSLKREILLSQEVTNYLKKRLSETEHRTYLWLHLLWNIIQKTLSGTKSGIDKLIDNLPNNIQGAYEVLLEKSPDCDFAKKVLQIVLAAARPLTLVEMDVALHIDRQTLSYTQLEQEGSERLRRTLPSRCGLMVSVIDDKIYFIHQTVKEFLVSKDGSQRPPGRVWQQSLDLKESHKVLAEACSQYLSFPEIRLDQTNFLNALLPDKSRNLEPNDYCRRFKFLPYSAIYWADHSRSLNNCELTKFVEIILKLIDQPLVIGKYDRNYGTMLHAASAGAHQAIVQILLDKGANINARGGLYNTALIAASAKGNIDIVRILLDKGADINAQGGRYSTALEAVVSKGYPNIVQMLIDKGADINAQGGKNSSTLLVIASLRGYTDIVQMLLDAGADINVPHRYYGTALAIASSEGYADIVQILLDKGADINVQSGNSDTALIAAVFRGHADIVQILLDKGADLNAQSEYYGTALIAASRQGHTDIVQILLDQSADINAQTRGDYSTTLIAASFGGYTDIVQILLDKGADINAQSGGDYSTTLIAASFGGHADIVQILLDKGADLNAQTESYHGTALAPASAEGHQDIVQILLDKGADINAQSGRFHNSALIAAASRNYHNIVQMLLERGADVNAQGGYYGTALKAASNENIRQLLIDNGATR